VRAKSADVEDLITASIGRLNRSRLAVAGATRSASSEVLHRSRLPSGIVYSHLHTERPRSSTARQKPRTLPSVKLESRASPAPALFPNLVDPLQLPSEDASPVSQTQPHEPLENELAQALTLVLRETSAAAICAAIVAGVNIVLPGWATRVHVLLHGDQQAPRCPSDTFPNMG
jgi:hypothetical protein